MEPIQNQPFVLIQCPKCKSRYRIDRSKIPEQGITVLCKKCQTKLLLKNKIHPPVPPPPESPPPDPDTCPKCGFKQKQGEICYKCGTRIRSLKPADVKSAEPLPGSESVPLCLLDLSLEYNNKLFFAGMLKPVIEIDHEAFHRNWGKYQFQLPPGEYLIRIFCPMTHIPLFEQVMKFQAGENEYVQLQYKVHSLDHVTFKTLIREPKAAWRLLVKPPAAPKSGSSTLKDYFIIIMVVSAYPYGLYLLWKSDRFNGNMKWVIGILGLLVNLYFISKIKLVNF